MTEAEISEVVFDALTARGVAEIDIDRVLAAIEVALSRDLHVSGLSPSEAKIVLMLSLARGRIVSRDALMEAIGSRSKDKVIDRFVCFIRARRPDLGAHIETIRGVGLRWIGPAITSEDRA